MYSYVKEKNNEKIVISSLLRIDNVAKLIRHGGIGEVV